MGRAIKKKNRKPIGYRRHRVGFVARSLRLVTNIETKSPLFINKTRASTRTHARKMFASKLASTSQIAGQKLVSSSSSSSRKPVSRGALQVSAFYFKKSRHARRQHFHANLSSSSSLIAHTHTHKQVRAGTATTADIKNGLSIMLNGQPFKVVGEFVSRAFVFFFSSGGVSTFSARAQCEFFLSLSLSTF